jgi:hypothetical protein
VAAEFVGYTEVQHVAQPPYSELCFAAIVSAMTGASLDESQEALVAEGLSKADGTTAPMGPAQLEVAGAELSITPFQSPFKGAKDPEGVMGLIKEQFVAGRAVALLYKKEASPEDGRHHWTLLTGYYDLDGEEGAVHVIDPKREQAEQFGRHTVIEMIKRSMDYAGVYAYALSAEHEPVPDESPEEPDAS